MPWGRLDDGLYDHPKLDALGRSKLPALGLWTLAISWSNRRLTDGFVPTDRVVSLGATRALAEALVSAGMFERADGGYLIHDFLAFNDSRSNVESKRAADAERKRRVRGQSHPESTSESTSESERTNSGTRARPHDRPRPDPTESVPDLDSPQPPASGGRRSNGTNPRAKADAARDLAEVETRAKTWRQQQRHLAYMRGAIREAELDEMNRADTPLVEIPDWEQHQAELRAANEQHEVQISESSGPAWLKVGS